MDEGTHIEIQNVGPEDLSGVVALARELQADEQAISSGCAPLDIGPDYVEAVCDDCRQFGGCISSQRQERSLDVPRCTHPFARSRVMRRTTPLPM